MHNHPDFDLTLAQDTKIVKRQRCLTTKTCRGVFCHDQDTGFIAGHIKRFNAGWTLIDLQRTEALLMLVENFFSFFISCPLIAEEISCY
jgi:hypothetical protein